MRIFSVALVVASAAFLFACSDTHQSNSSEAEKSSKDVSREDSANAQTVPPANSNIDQNGPNAVPGLSGNGNESNAVLKGATPTPGIPDEETVRKQLEQTNVDPNVVNRPSRKAPDSNVKTRDKMGRPRRANSN